MRPALAVVEDTSPGRSTTASSATIPWTARDFHVCRVAVVWRNERLPSLDHLCDQELVSSHAASDDCFHLPACCVPNRVEKEDELD